MNRDVVIISRKELYEQVWTEPVTQLAKRYGFSDVWLAKICRKNYIPRPPRGYWAQKQSGIKIPKPPLPKRKDDPIIHINIGCYKPKEKNIIYEENIAKRRAIPNIVVPEILNEPHPLIVKTAEILLSCKQDEAGILISPVNARCLNVRVSRDSLSRALRIMDALIKNLAAMGFEVSILEKTTNVKVLDVLVSIGIGEELQRKRMEAKDQDLDNYYQFGYNLYGKQPIPSGILFLTIDDLGFYPAGDCRRNWRDTESTRLENSLKSFISGLIKAAAIKKAKNSTADGQE